MLIRKVFLPYSLQFKKVENPVIWRLVGLGKPNFTLDSKVRATEGTLVGNKMDNKPSTRRYPDSPELGGILQTPALLPAKGKGLPSYTIAVGCSLGQRAHQHFLL